MSRPAARFRPSRRGVLVGALAGGGLALGYALRPRNFAPPLRPGPDAFAFDAWLTIGRDGVVTVAVPQVEMGQGVTTLLPQIVAHELGADWRQVSAEPAPPSGLYANAVLAARWAPLWMPAASAVANDPDGMLARRWAQDRQFAVTADGTALAAYEAPARAAAATARALLMQAAAARWDMDWEDCEAQDGFVLHGDRRLPFGALAESAASYDPPATPLLRAAPMTERPADQSPGTPLRYPRLDMPSKVDGSWNFAGDVRHPGMVYAAIRHAPVATCAALGGLNEDAARRVRGFLKIVRGPDWVAAVAGDSWSAENALTASAPTFTFEGGLSSTAADAVLEEAMRAGTGRTVHAHGDEDLARGGLPVQIRYEVAPALHASIETASAAAWLRNGRMELWIGTQAPEAVRRAVARALGMGIGDVVVYGMPIGGSFDRRLEASHGVEAALIARDVGKPVQLTWSRREEQGAGLPRPPAVAVMAARMDSEGGIAAWRARIAAPPAMREFGRRFLDGDTPAQAIAAVAGEGDPLALAGAVPTYGIANVVVDHVPASPGLPSGRLRGNAHGYTAFFNESFVDELAHRAGREPLSYRMAMLGGNVRMAECLQRVAALAQWGGGGDASGQGIACHAIDGGRIALVATARRDADGARVDRLSAVVDIGRIVNLDIARQQIEGGLVFGLGLALGCTVRYERGRPEVETLGAMGLPTLADCPQIDVEFIESAEDPADPGELGVAVVAPAVANALYSATGLRFRRLPLFAEEL